MGKIRVAVIFGGKSGEHEVSLQSAASILKAIDYDKFEVLPIAISKEGSWKVGQGSIPFLDGKMESSILERLVSNLPQVQLESSTAIPRLDPQEIDIVFPVLHGTYGEDGTIHGLFEMANFPYVGAGVLASAVGMDKVICKKIFAVEGLPQGAFLSYLRSTLKRNMEKVLDGIQEAFGYPCFVKPANLGSSVGISKANHREELKSALELAAKYDRKVIVEEFIPAREVEVSVLGNDDPKASIPGEIISSNDFYDYKAKYIDGKSVMQIPAELPQETLDQIRELAVKAYRAIDCAGFARVDFFVRKDTGEILINEVNTLPGFTSISMYPVMWERTGLPYTELITRLIELGMERYEDRKQSLTSFEMK